MDGPAICATPSVGIDGKQVPKWHAVVCSLPSAERGTGVKTSAYGTDAILGVGMSHVELNVPSSKRILS